MRCSRVRQRLPYAHQHRPGQVPSLPTRSMSFVEHPRSMVDSSYPGTCTQCLLMNLLKRYTISTTSAHWKILCLRVDDNRSERFTYSEPWSDPEGLLPLSAKQQRYLGGWHRPSQFVAKHTNSTPTMISAISPFNITQDLVTDCSFVASLCITAAFEKRHRRQLITGIIYPQVSTPPLFSTHQEITIPLPYVCVS